MSRQTDLEFPTEGQLSIISQLNPSAESVCGNWSGAEKYQHRRLLAMIHLSLCSTLRPFLSFSRTNTAERPPSIQSSYDVTDEA